MIHHSQQTLFLVLALSKVRYQWSPGRKQKSLESENLI